MKKKLLLAICLMASLAGYGQTVDFDRAAKKMTITGLTAGTLGTIITDGTGGTENLRGATVNTIPDPNIVPDDDSSGDTRPGSTIQVCNDDVPIETLIISGQLNGADIKIIADMARRWIFDTHDEGTYMGPFDGYDEDSNPIQYNMMKYVRTMTYVLTGGLKYLDLSGAQIVKDSNPANNIYFDVSEGKFNGVSFNKITTYNGGNINTCTSNYNLLEQGDGGVYSVENDNEIGDAMFVGCDMLETIILPETATLIGNVAFMRFMKMEEMTIPASVETIESYAFWQAFNMDTAREGVPTTIIKFEGAENKVTLEENALAQYDNQSGMVIHGYEPAKIAAVESSISLLGDYAVDEVIRENVEAGFVRGKAAPPNKYWTFSCGVDVVVPDGVDVYVTTINDGEAKRRPLTDTELDLEGVGKRVIPANNGVLLACPGDTGNAYDMVVQYNAGITSIDATKDAKSWGDQNALVPVIRKAHYNPGDYYMLYHGKWVVLASDAEQVPAGKALLKK